jgi:hypothetical protein
VVVSPWRRPGWVAGVPAVVALLVAVRAALLADSLPAGAAEARFVDAAAAALQPSAAPAGVGLDGLAARLQLSGYATATGAFERHPDAVDGARELALVACVVVLGAVLALMRSLGVRPLPAAVVLGGLAACTPAVAALVTVGPGLLGAAWLTLGAALLVRRHPAVRALGAPAVVAGVLTAPVLAVPVLVGGAAVLVALRVGRGALILGMVPLSVVPLALLPPPGGPAAVPALVVAVVLIALVLADDTVGRVGRWTRR